MTALEKILGTTLIGVTGAFTYVTVKTVVQLKAIKEQEVEIQEMLARLSEKLNQEDN